MTYTVTNLTAYLLVFLRMTGMIAINPVFARRNVPARARVILILALTLLMAPGVGAVAEPDTLSLIVLMLKEAFVGLVCGMVFQFFYYLLFFAGDLMDMQFGLSMARVFDPGTSIQTSVSGNFLNVLFMLYFFATDSHLVLFRAMAASFQLVPVGAVRITGDVAGFMITLFSSVFSLALRLALPFVAAEFVIEIAMGVLMKLIPQIHVFVINIQFKVLLGIFMLLVFCQPIGDFIDSYMGSILQSIQKALLVLGG